MVIGTVLDVGGPEHFFVRSLLLLAGRSQFLTALFAGRSLSHQDNLQDVRCLMAPVPSDELVLD